MRPAHPPYKTPPPPRTGAQLCEGGNLREALGNGALSGAAAAALAPGGPRAGDFAGTAKELLLDVASALAHLHAVRVVHGAVEAENVLLHTDPRRGCGFVAKVRPKARSRRFGAAPRGRAAPAVACFWGSGRALRALGGCRARGGLLEGAV